MARPSLSGFKLPSTERNHTTPRRAVVALLLLLVAGAWLYWNRLRATPTAALRGAQPTAAASTPAPAQVQPEARAAQALAASGEANDDRLRLRLSSLSPRPEWQAWLAQARDLIETGAVLIANLAEDEDPRKRLAPLNPTVAFLVEERDGRFYPSDASAARFDLPTAVIASIDPRGLASLWHALHPLLAVAYDTVGRPGVSLDQAAGLALHRIESAPVADTAPVLERAGQLWLYQDPALEQRGPVEKLLLRLGAQNERKLQAKAREIRASLSLS